MKKLFLVLTLLSQVGFAAQFQCDAKSLLGRKFLGTPSVDLITAQNSAVAACKKKALVCKLDKCVVVALVDEDGYIVDKE